MSIIAALKTPTGVWIGSDTMAVNCGIKEHFGPKYVQCGKYWVGVAGQIRAKNLIQSYAEEIGKQPNFIGILNLIEKAVADDKWKPTENVGEPNRFMLELIITDGNRLISVGGSFGYIECDKVAVIGSGTEAALGAYLALENTLFDSELIERMVDIACQINHNCGGGAETSFVEMIDAKPGN